jgi:hypothetical protein
VTTMAMIDDVLCFLQSARASLDEENIVRIAISYYTPEMILQSKERIFKTCEEELVKRRISKQHPNPIIKDIIDIIDLMTRMEGCNKELPQYVSRGYGFMPSNDFGRIADIICAIRDEVCALRIELCETRSDREKDKKITEDNVIVKSEISDIKMMTQMIQNDLKTKQEKKQLKKESERKRQESEKMTVKDATPLNVRKNQSRIETTSSKPEEASNDATSVEPKRTSVKEAPTVKEVKTNEKKTYSTVLKNKEGPFTLVQKKKFKKTKNDIKGTKDINNTGASFLAAKKIIDIYIGGCDLNTSSEGLKNFCEQQDVTVSAVYELNVKGRWYKSYKLSIDIKFENIIMDPEFWYEGIIIRKFINFRNFNPENRS